MNGLPHLPPFPNYACPFVPPFADTGDSGVAATINTAQGHVTNQGDRVLGIGRDGGVSTRDGVVGGSVTSFSFLLLIVDTVCELIKYPLFVDRMLVSPTLSLTTIKLPIVGLRNERGK